MNPLLEYLNKKADLIEGSPPEKAIDTGGAEEWEKRASASMPVENPQERLWEILSQTMTERQFRSLTGRR